MLQSLLHIAKSTTVLICLWLSLQPELNKRFFFLRRDGCFTIFVAHCRMYQLPGNIEIVRPYLPWSVAESEGVNIRPKQKVLLRVAQCTEFVVTLKFLDFTLFDLWGAFVARRILIIQIPKIENLKTFNHNRLHIYTKFTFWLWLDYRYHLIIDKWVLVL